MLISEAAVGNPHVRCDYTLLDSGELKAVGLPIGMTLRRPSKYSVPEKKAILAAKEELTFEGKKHMSALLIAFHVIFTGT